MSMQFFLIDEDFESIIKNVLKDQIIKEIKPITTGWTNIVYRVTTNEDNYYFRFPRDEFWERTIVKDHEFAQFILGKTSFNTVDLKLFYDKERPFSVHREIPGIPLAEKMNSMSEDDVEKVSKQIAKFMYELHNVKEEDKIFSINNIGLELNDFINELLEKHVSENDMKFWKTNNFKIFDRDLETKCLVHGDLNSSNILLDDNNNVTAVIDFGFAGYGNKYFDIARIIGRCPKNFEKSIAHEYELLENKKINEEELNKNIDIWNNIDQGYINYMKSIKLI